MLAAPSTAFSHERGHEFELPSIEEDFSLAENASSCTPDEEFDLCYEMDLADPEYWQDQGDSDPDWRTVEAAPKELDVDYVVTLHTKALNGGIVPTATGQGEYDDMDALIDAYSEFIGVNARDNTYYLLTSGSSAKLGHDGTPASVHYGIFVYDALSNHEGKIIIDGEDRTADFIDRTRTQEADFHEIHADGTTQELDNDADTLLSINSQTEDFSTTTLMLSELFNRVVEDRTKVFAELGNNYWEGELRAIYAPEPTDAGIYSFELSMQKKNETRCGWSFGFDGIVPILKWQCFETSMDIEGFHIDSDDNIIDALGMSSELTEILTLTGRYNTKPGNPYPGLARFCADGWLRSYSDGHGRVTTDAVEPEDCPLPDTW